MKKQEVAVRAPAVFQVMLKGDRISGAANEAAETRQMKKLARCIV